MERLEAIQKSLKLIPPEFEMTAFVAYANGFKKAQERAQQQERDQVHPGGAVVYMFPGGKIRI